MVNTNDKFLPMDDRAGIIVALACFALIALGKDSSGIQGILFIVIGFMFGKHTKKARR